MIALWFACARTPEPPPPPPPPPEPPAAPVRVVPGERGVYTITVERESAGELVFHVDAPIVDAAVVVGGDAWTAAVDGDHVVATGVPGPGPVTQVAVFGERLDRAEWPKVADAAAGTTTPPP